ncbi:MAG: arginine--tRNA ligase [Firmicutes bacterium]|nr:arginine--tRNA ligase [Bacillota bacterium]
MNIKTQIEKELQAVFKALGFDERFATINTSQVGDADYQCNACFQIAKMIGKAPYDVAVEIADVFKHDSKIVDAEPSKPGFVNFFIIERELERIANFVLKKNQLPLAPQDKQTIFFDYGGANIAKELHAGHLRSPVIGEALKRTHMAFGHKAISCTYLGDWGLQIGLVIAECEFGGIIRDGKFKREITLDLLNEIYPNASKRKDVDPTFKKRAEDITVKTQNLEQPYYGMWQELWRVSVNKIRENYLALGCTFDFYNGESHAEPYVDIIMKMLEPLSYIDKDCVMINVAEKGEHIPLPRKVGEPQRYENPFPPVILKKGNGGDLYSTSDVATIYYRYNNHKPDRFIYVTDFRQELHFRQVFRIAKKGNIVPENIQFTHVGYGAMTGSDGKPFKTRAGGTIKLDDIINLVTDASKKRLEESGRDTNQDTARKIGIAALKFADLSNNVRRDFMFDIDKFTSFEGRTGPYILYTIARINSIFEKAKVKPKTIKFDTTDLHVVAIVKKIIRLTDAYTATTQTLSLNSLTDATYELAGAFNNFYSNNQIIGSSKEKTYLALCLLVKQSLEIALNTLAIEVVESM